MAEFRNEQQFMVTLQTVVQYFTYFTTIYNFYHFYFVLGCVYFNKSSLSYNTASVHVKRFIKMHIYTEVNCI